jgi:hypothetical protein
MNSNVKQWIFGILGVVGFFFGLMLFRDAFRTYTALFAVIWVAIPIFACFLRRREPITQADRRKNARLPL